MIRRELESVTDEARWAIPIAEKLPREWVQHRMADNAARMIAATGSEIDAYVTVHLDFVARFHEDPLAGDRSPGHDLSHEVTLEATEDIRKLNQRYNAWVSRLRLRVQDELYDLVSEWYDDGDRLELSPGPWGVFPMTEPDGVASLKAVRAFREFCDDHPNATIGLAGPRGCGKSTLLENRPDPSLPLKSDRVRVNVSAPVKYETQAFLLHLFAEVCRAVVDYRHPEFREHFPRIRIAFPARRVVSYAALGVFAYTLAVTLSIGSGGALSEPFRAMAAYLGAAWQWMWQPLNTSFSLGGVVQPVPALAVVALLCLTVVTVRSLRWALVTRRDVPDLVRTAKRHLETIRTIQTASAGVNGEVGVAGLKLVASHSVQRAAREWTAPELVGELRRFLAEVYDSDQRAVHHLVETEPGLRPVVAAVLSQLLARIDDTEEKTWVGGQVYRSPPVEPGVVITIDELDKLDNVEDAQLFVNELKGLFGARGTQVIVSVSEDALNSFELRGLPMRDAFDSAFKHVFRIDYLSISDTRRILERMGLEWVSRPFVWLVYLVSGGLPRDVARVGSHLNAVARENPGARLRTVAHRLVARDMAQRLSAFERTCGGRLQDYDATGAASNTMSDSAILHVIREIRRVRKDERPISAGELLDHAAVIRQIQDGGIFANQVASYLCYCGSVLEVLDVDALEKETKEYEELLPTLGRARQSMAVHPDLAIELIDEFRNAWGLGAVARSV